jgi:hypothetical protein
MVRRMSPITGGVSCHDMTCHDQKTAALARSGEESAAPSQTKSVIEPRPASCGLPPVTIRAVRTPRFNPVVP